MKTIPSKLVGLSANGMNEVRDTTFYIFQRDKAIVTEK